jgi:hypothetical protein
MVYADRVKSDYDNQLAIAARYKNANSHEESVKIQALKDVTLDPHLIDNPADGLVQSLNRWKVVAHGVMQNAPDKKDEVATNYYNKEIKPFYDKLGLPNAMPPELWKQNAYSEKGALQFEVEDGYHNSVSSLLRRGARMAGQEYESAMSTGTNLLGLAIHTGGDLLAAASKFSAANSSTPEAVAKWHQAMQIRQASQAKAYGGKGLFDTAEAVTKDIPVLGKFSETLKSTSQQDEFWSNVNPARGYTDTIGSHVVEMGATLPIFKAISLGNIALGEGIKSTEFGASLTKTLMATKMGQIVAHALTLGSEGTAWGVLTRPNDDKVNAWQDGLGFMAMGTMFHVAGEKLNLGDAIKKGGDPTAIADHEVESERLRMSAEDGKRVASPEEKRKAYIKKTATEMSQGVKHKEVYQEALHHIATDETQNRTPEQIAELEKKMKDSDPVHASVVLAAKNFIKDALGGKKAASIMKDKAASVQLGKDISNLLQDSYNHLNRAAAPIAESNAAHGAPNPKMPGTRITRDAIKAKVLSKIQEQGIAKSVTPDQIEKMVDAEYTKAQAKGAARAEAHRISDPVGEAQDVAEVRTKQLEGARKSGQETKGSSKSTIYGLKEGASASHNTQHIAYLKSQGVETAAERQKWYKDLDSTDFEKELEEYFYPKDLKDAGIYFEHEGPSGKDPWKAGDKLNPNFLAFMYNYKDQMPKETAEHLEQELQDALKYKGPFKGFRATDQQMYHFALQMYNHVDQFVGSTSFLKKGERNIFRSTAPDLLNPTKYQKELLNEVHVENIKNIKEMFEPGKDRKAAMTAYKMFASDLNAIFEEKPSLKQAQRFQAKYQESQEDLVNRSGGALIPWRF